MVLSIGLLLAGVVAVVVVAGAAFYLVGPHGGGGVATTTIIPTTTSVAPGGLNATEASLPEFVSGQQGGGSLFSKINGHSAAYTCALAQGSTPPTGLVVGANCQIGGTVTLSPGTSREVSPPFTVVLTGANPPLETANFTFSVIIVSEGPTLVPVDGECIVNVECHSQIATADGGTPPYYYVNDLFRYGATPFGLSIGTDGFITGTARQTGLTDFGICVVDSVNAETCGQTSVNVVNETNSTVTTTVNTTTSTTTENYTTTIFQCGGGDSTYPNDTCYCPSGKYVQPDGTCAAGCPDGWEPSPFNTNGGYDCVYSNGTTNSSYTGCTNPQAPYACYVYNSSGRYGYTTCNSAPCNGR